MITFDFDDTLTLPQKSKLNGYWINTLLPNEKVLARLREFHARGEEIRIEEPLVFLVGELEERQRAAVSEPEEGVAVHPLGTEELVGL